jgi:deazaflavin-dependent oxidoreductase (nitroreductase family)
VATHKRTKTLEMVWRFHRKLFNASGGRVWTKFGGMPIAMVTTTGRRSGQPRSVTIPFFKDGEAYVFVGSNAGAPKDPDWVQNMRANPQATVKLRGTEIPVRGHEAADDERTQLWTRAIEINGDYAEYGRLITDRQIPVMVLEPVG